MSSQYEVLKQLIAERLGLQLNEHRVSVLVKAVERLIALDQFGNAHELYTWLLNHDSNHPTWQQLIQELTIGETYFYRNQGHMNALQRHVLPQIINQRRQSGQRYLRLWSAGCATGEEPYSLSMILYDLLPDIRHWSITLMATDLNEAYLERARDGVYRAHSFRGETPDWVQSRWFKADNGLFELLPQIRDMVKFVPLNLTDVDYQSAVPEIVDMDLIVCRNVTIYFDRPTTAQIISQFHGLLASEGWLLVGHSEPQPGVYSKFEARNFENAVVYHKLAERPISISSVNLTTPMFSELNPVEVAVVPPQASEIATSDSELWELARQAADHERWTDAFELLAMVEQHDVLQPQVHYLRGLMFIQMGNVADARTALRQSIYCDPAFALAHYALGDLYARSGEQNDAQRYWQRARNALKELDAEAPVPYGDDLTVEMLDAILVYRLQNS